uniref:Chromosome 14 C5orf47 homolog n=1 Tax=Equus caballus TaxID=9796 RepID=A0A3Q2H594_HORSE|nr:uncharacterized protein C5orf47 homolog isoform X2 [Equus caballus]
MAAAGGGRTRPPAACVYVARFGAHRCGGVLQLGGRRSPGLGATCSRAGAPDGGGRPPGPGPRPPAAPSDEPASSAQSSPAPAARAGLTQKNLAKKFDFPIPLNEASKILKKKKKVLAWNRVYKVISRMLEENEKYRLRLKRQQLSSENSDHTG